MRGIVEGSRRYTLVANTQTQNLQALSSRPLTWINRVKKGSAKYTDCNSQTGTAEIVFMAKNVLYPYNFPFSLWVHFSILPFFPIGPRFVPLSDHIVEDSIV